MKRIIDGVTYNTDTSTLIAKAETVEPEWGGNPEERKNFTLYQTRGAAFFVHTHIEWTVLNRRTEQPEDRERDVFEPMTRDEAHKWTMEGEVELLNDVFGEPPEAAAEEAPGATLYVRMPASLKDRAEEQARDEGVSLNTWTMRCVERCADMRRVGAALGEIHDTWLHIESEPESGAFTESQVREMMNHMHDQAEGIARILGWSAADLDELSTDQAGAYGHQTWQPYDEEAGWTQARSSANSPWSRSVGGAADDASSPRKKGEDIPRADSEAAGPAL